MTTSIAILTLNAGSAFRDTLDAIELQSSPPLEVVVVDSGSEDGTVELARCRGAIVHEIPREQFDFGLTRDLAFERTRGDLIVSLSQDVVPKHAGWLDKLTAPFVNPQVAFASARCEARDPETMFLWQRLGKFYFTHEYHRFRARHGKPCSHANSCVRRTAWETLRHGPMPIAEDMMLQKRIRAAELEVKIIDEPLAWHQHSFTVDTAFKRAFNEGHAARRLDVPYTALDAVSDSLRLDTFGTLVRQIKYGRVNRLVDLYYPWLRPLAVWAGHRFGRSYWR